MTKTNAMILLLLTLAATCHGLYSTPAIMFPISRKKAIIHSATNFKSAFVPTVTQKHRFLKQKVRHHLPSPSSSSFLTLSSSPDGNNDNNSKDNEWNGFNPFERRTTKDTSNPVIGGTSSQISYRRLRMNEIMSELLQNVQSDKNLDQILSQNGDFLLEQLEDIDAVLEVDSIYTPNMTREERYNRYRDVMTERIDGAKNVTVRKVLESLRDFVLSHE